MAALTPPGKQQYLTNTGAPLAGGRLYTYNAGTNTPRSTYQDAAGTVPNTNPVVLDARGEALVFWNGNYKVELRDASNSLIWTVDNIQDPGSYTDSKTVGLAETVAKLNGLTFILASTDNSGDITAANAVGKPVVFVGVANVLSARTLTVPIVDTTAQIFSAGALITIANGLPVRPEWFGMTAGSVYRAARALPQPLGGIVQLRDVTYPGNNFAYEGAYMDVPNVTFRGSRMPVLTTDCRGLTGGTIIQDTFLVFADNVGIENLGIDCGANFLGGIAARDALMCTYASTALKTANALRKGLRLHNVIGLGKGPTDLTHAVIAGEGYADVTVTGEITGCFGGHGIVFKCQQVKGGATLSAYCNGFDGVIFKTDAQTTALARDISVGDIFSFADGPDGWTPYATAVGVANAIGVFVHAFGGNISKIKTGHVNERGHDKAVVWQMDSNYTIDNVQMGDIVTDNNTTSGGLFAQTLFALATYQRCKVGHIVARNAPSATTFVWQAPSHISVESVHGVNISVAVAAVSGNAAPVIGTLIAENAAAAYQLTSSAKPKVGKTLLTGTTTVYHTTAGSGQVPVLANSWAQVSGGDTFNVIQTHYGIEINGLISGGSSNIIMTLPQWAHPPSEKRFVLQGRASSTQTVVPVHVSTAGVVTINDAAPSIANVTSYLSLAGISYSLTN